MGCFSAYMSVCTMLLYYGSRLKPIEFVFGLRVTNLRQRRATFC